MNPFDWLYHFFGIGGSGPYYGFWSGAGSDITELAILGAIIQGARHINCHSKGCWRVGKPVDGTPYRACHHHHPDHQEPKRNVPLQVILDAHAKTPG